MATMVRDIMTSDPISVEARTPVKDTARLMRDSDVGAVIVLDNGNVVGVTTDRDIAVRVVADGLDVNSTPIAKACSGDVETVGPDTSLDQAVSIMRNRAVRRLPVVENGKPVGIVSIGDLAVEKDETSALADISAAPGNR
jgi:CBS domain-containing protein